MYWKAFNVFVRLLGVGFVIVGIIIAVSALSAASDNAFVQVVGALIIAGLGAGMLFVRPYRPDLGDVSATVDPFRARADALHPSRRSWWTGTHSRP